MTLPTTANYDNLNGNVQDRVFVLSIPSKGLYFSSLPVRGLGNIRAPIYSEPSLPRRQIDLLNSKSSSSGISVDLFDAAGAVSSALTDGFIQLDASLSQGFRALPWAEYLIRHTGRIKTTSSERDGTVFRVQIDSRTNQIDQVKLFQKAEVAGEYCSGPGGTAVYTSTDAGAGTYATLTLEDRDLDGVFETVVLTGNPFHIALCILLSGGTSTSIYNAWPGFAGCALTDAEVDADKFEEARDLWDGEDFEFILDGEENAKSFLEKDILRVFCGYLTETGTGRIGCSVPSVPNPTLSLPLFDDTVILGPQAWIEDEKLLITSVGISMDHDGSEYQTFLPRIASRRYLEGRYPEDQPWDLESRGLKTDRGGLLTAKIIISSVLRRFGVVPRRGAFQAFSKMDLTEAGDHVRVQSSLSVNADIPRQLGQTAVRYAEVVSLQPGTPVQVELIDLTSPAINDGFRSAVIAPNATPDYTAASTAERQYAFAADDATEEMSNGDPGYTFS